MAEGARLESVYTFTGIVGSNPTLSANLDASGPECVAWKDTHSYQFQDNFCIRRLQASIFGFVWAPLNHMRDVGRLCRVVKEHVFEIGGGHSRPHGQSEEVDDFRSLST